jgi:DNA invertase Pin-like site-specific DNA recombinase
MSPGKTIGYIRVSTYEQNPERQLDGVKLDRIFTDKASGKNTKRPQLAALLNYVRDGDIIIIHSMDRLARNLDDLRKLVYDLTARHITIQFVKEKLTFTADESPMANLLLSVMGAFAEFERALIRERQLEGIAIAKKRGAYKGRKKALNNEQVQKLKKQVTAGEQKSKIAREFGISRETLYQYLKQDSNSSDR